LKKQIPRILGSFNPHGYWFFGRVHYKKIVFFAKRNVFFSDFSICHQQFFPIVLGIKTVFFIIICT